MGANLKTSVYGDLSFETIWSHSSGLHIGRLTRGGYAYVGSGIPVSDRAHLALCMVPGPDLQHALNWFDHKDEQPDPGPPARGIYYKRIDRGYHYIDNDQLVTNSGDLYTAFEDTPVLDHALRWWGLQAQRGPGGTAPEPEGPDEKILAYVGETQVTGAAREEMVKALNIRSDHLVQILDGMCGRQQLVFYAKRWYLPKYAPKAQGE